MVISKVNVKLKILPTKQLLEYLKPNGKNNKKMLIRKQSLIRK